MNDEQRFALHFGPYQAPSFNYGDVVMDAVRDEVMIYKLSDAKIPWPIGKRGSALSLVVYAGLADAIRKESNQAVAHWWGVRPPVVSRWRQALGVPKTTEGSKALWSLNGKDERCQVGLDETRYDEDRIAKAAAARRGKSRPAHVVAAMRKASLGRKHSQRSRELHSQTNKAKGIHPPLPGPLWTEAEDNLVRTLSPREAARRTKRTLGAIYCRRSTLRVLDGRRTR